MADIGIGKTQTSFLTCHTAFPWADAAYIATASIGGAEDDRKLYIFVHQSQVLPHGYNVE